MEIKEIREYYIEEWKLRLKELNELGYFIQDLKKVIKMEIKEIREYYIEEWKLRLKELNELGYFIQALE